MKAEYLNAFLLPSVRVIEKMAGLSVQVGSVSRLLESRTEDHVSILIGLQGPLSGSVVLAVPREVARLLASRIANEELAEEAEADVRAILAELANTIVGNATGHLYNIGIREGITPPTIVEGDHVLFGFVPDLETVEVPLHTAVGRCALIVSIARQTS